MPPLEFVEDTLPEGVIVALAIIALVLCIYAGWKAQDRAARGYIIPVSFVLVIFVYYWAANPALLTREFLSRAAFMMLLADICIWRVFSIIAGSRRGPR